MKQITRRPTSAAVEFDGDCYGKLYSKTAPECNACIVRKRCRRSIVPDLKEDDMAKKNKKEKVEKKEAKAEKELEVKVRPVAKAFKKDKENFGLRPGSAGWAIYQTMRECLDKKFSVEELATKTTVFCKLKETKEAFEGAIKFNADAKVPIMLRHFVKSGLIQRIKKGKGGNDEYKQVV
jgi:hypothetical protein